MNYLKPIHGVNGTPVSFMPGYPDVEDQFNQMGIPFVRLHDAFGIGDLDNGMSPYYVGNSGQMLENVPFNEKQTAELLFCEISNLRSIYPSLKKYTALYERGGDLNYAVQQIINEANYAPTDSYIKKILSNSRNNNPYLNRKILFRIGRSNDGGATSPNTQIYARLAAELVKRYSLPNQYDGENDCLIMDWEIWNEPDLGMFFSSNSPDAYYELYKECATQMKRINPAIRVGGPATASAGNNPYTYGFIQYCSNNNVPLDIFSFHIYLANNEIPNFYDIPRTIRGWLDNHGFKSTLLYVTEWAPLYLADTNSQRKYQTAKAAAFDVAALIGMQEGGVDAAFYYRADAGPLGIIAQDNSGSVQLTYPCQAFYLFNQMFETPQILFSAYTAFNPYQVDNFCFMIGKNEAGNRYKCLVSTYINDSSYFINQNLRAPQNFLEYYIDSSRSIDEFNDTYSVDKWFGGVNPNNLKQGMADPSTYIVNRGFGNDEKSYSYPFTFNGINSIGTKCNFSRIKELNSYVIKQGGSLYSIVPDKGNLSAVIDNGSLHFEIPSIPDCVFMIDVILE